MEEGAVLKYSWLSEVLGSVGLGLDGFAGLKVSTLSATMFMVLHLSVLRATAWGFPELFASLQRRGKALEWRNYCVSYVFIWAASVSVVGILLTEGEVLDDLIVAESDACRLLICFAIGYFFADTVDMYRGNHLSLDMVVHHGVILIAYGASVVKNLYAPYLVVTLIAETNTIFLHARKLMLLAGVDAGKSVAYRVVLACLYLLFPVQRCIPHLWLLGQIYADWDRFNSFWQFGLAFFGMLAINILNFILLRGLIVSDIKILNLDWPSHGISTKSGGTISKKSL